MNRLLVRLGLGTTLLALGVAVWAAALSLPTQTYAQTAPQFKLGFKSMAEQMAGVAGQPAEDENWGANGDSLQHTTTGLMVWRKADNWTAFTDGSRTWINGPTGIQDRSNDERFEWESVVPPLGGNGKYDGQFQDGKRQGVGTFTWENGDSYSGDWRDGKMHGQGVLQFKGVGEYRGSFASEKRSGQGTFTWLSGDRYEGAWENDLPHGSGKYSFASGASYNGEWSNGKMHGRGTYGYANGVVVSGRWDNNTLVEVSR